MIGETELFCFVDRKNLIYRRSFAALLVTEPSSPDFCTFYIEPTLELRHRLFERDFQAMASLFADLRHSECNLRFDSHFHHSRVTKVQVCARRRARNNEDPAEDVQHEHRPTFLNLRGESFDPR